MPGPILLVSSVDNPSEEESDFGARIVAERARLVVGEQSELLDPNLPLDP